MHTIFPIIAAMTASARLAAPASVGNPTPLMKRDNVTVNYAGGPACQGTNVVFADTWGVYMPNDTMGVEADANGLGGGLLDNLRGRCGDITGWSPSRDDPGTGLGATFATSDFCTAFDITQAILAASGGTNVDCTWNEDVEVTLEGIADFINAFGEAVEGIWEAIGLFLEAI